MLLRWERLGKTAQKSPVGGLEDQEPIDGLVEVFMDFDKAFRPQRRKTFA